MNDKKFEKKKFDKNRKPTFNDVADISSWIPRSNIGKQVKTGTVNDINYLIDNNIPIKEVEIVDKLIPNLESDLLLVGQGKGKFGRGQRRAFRQSQKKTEDGNTISFTSMSVVGNKKGLVGIGAGKSGETVPAREKALKNAKKNLMRIKMGCGSWECGCGEDHSIPFAVSGKCGSVRIKLMPAPKGVGLCIHTECQKILKLAGIKDVWSWTNGSTDTMLNLVAALKDALTKLTAMKVISK